ncbi:MAG: phosphoribosylformylglycinamidine synthase I [Candidatus Omnitrophica bacterium]|nr:phosphoribosylformylglycinamidine synthase I [Candidatus Omnitrophota bacterium]
MSNIKALIIRTAGTNCDQETKVALELLRVRVTMMHVNELIKGGDRIDRYQIVAFPGGFTYGDDIAAGKILANELKMKLGDELQKFLARNGLMIGICNGFQVLVKMGILPGNKDWRQEATLSCNDSGKFEDRWVYLTKPAATCCVWTRGIDKVIYLPVAHGEGKFITKDPGTGQRLRDNGQVVFQYCDKNGNDAGYPANPNGSVGAIAGICDTTGRIFGLMPHPERCVFRTQHPRWTREKPTLVPDGLAIFRSAVDFLTKT